MLLIASLAAFAGEEKQAAQKDAPVEKVEGHEMKKGHEEHKKHNH